MSGAHEPAKELATLGAIQIQISYVVPLIQIACDVTAFFSVALPSQTELSWLEEIPWDRSLDYASPCRLCAFYMFGFPIRKVDTSTQGSYHNNHYFTHDGNE